jgi:hypothetical protein
MIGPVRSEQIILAPLCFVFAINTILLSISAFLVYVLYITADINYLPNRYLLLQQIK